MGKNRLASTVSQSDIETVILSSILDFTHPELPNPVYSSQK